MIAREAMTISPAVVTTDDSIERAAELMRDWDTGLIPVVANLSTMELVGVITDRDIVTRCIAAHHLGGCDVTTHMTTHKLATVYPETPLQSCALRMEQAQVRRRPVVDVDGRLVGVVSVADIARKLATSDPVTGATLIEEISQPVAVHV
ncbi:MAG: CBS domain-containing protein [Gemmatimonas sp.]